MNNEFVFIATILSIISGALIFIAFAVSHIAKRIDELAHIARLSATFGESRPDASGTSATEDRLRVQANGDNK